MIGTVPVLDGEHSRSRSTSSRASTRRSALSSPAREWFDLLDAPSKQWIDLPPSGHWPHFRQPADCAGVRRTVLSDTR
jgi:pimeloyl-ACP methyl ester carboxylesterase